MIFFTDNLTTTEAVNVNDDEIIGSISLKTQAGQVSDNSFFRIGVDADPYDDPYGSVLPVTIWTNDPAITLSTDSVRGFSPAAQQAIEPGKVGSTVFVRVTADLDATEGDRTGQVFVNSEILTVHYFVAEADKGDTENSPMDRLSGDDTISVLEQFDQQGEALELVRYDPLPKPAPLLKGTLYPWQALQNRNVTEWTNPSNGQVGYSQTIYHAKGFVGDNDLMQNLQYAMPLDLNYGDAEQILLPADFVGFDPTPFHERVFFSQLTPTQKAYQRTQWTVKRHDGEYALVNIRKQKYYRGQLMFFAADLQRINYPGGESLQGFLPWSQLYDEDDKIIGYVPGFSRAEVEDAYCEYGSDAPYVEPETPTTTTTVALEATERYQFTFNTSFSPNYSASSPAPLLAATLGTTTRAYVEWDVSSIPDDAAITDWSFSYLVKEPQSTTDYDLEVHIAPAQPSANVGSEAAIQEVFQSITDSIGTPTGSQDETTLTFTPNDATDLQSAIEIGQDWFALMVRWDDEGLTNTKSFGISRGYANLILSVTYEEA